MATVRLVPRARSTVFEDAALAPVGVPSDSLTHVLLPKGRSINRHGFSALHSVGKLLNRHEPRSLIKEARRSVIRIGVRWRERLDHQKPGAPATSAGHRRPKHRRRPKPVCRTIRAEIRAPLGRWPPAHRTQASAAEQQWERLQYAG